MQTIADPSPIQTAGYVDSEKLMDKQVLLFLQLILCQFYEKLRKKELESPSTSDGSEGDENNEGEKGVNEDPVEGLDSVSTEDTESRTINSLDSSMSPASSPNQRALEFSYTATNPVAISRLCMLLCFVF